MAREFDPRPGVPPLPASTRAALPPPESGSSGLGSASALEVEEDIDVALNHLTDFSREIYGTFSPHDAQVLLRHYDVLVAVADASELVASVARSFVPVARCKRFNETVALLASATKPEASPRPENHEAVQDYVSAGGSWPPESAELGAAIRPRVEVGGREMVGAQDGRDGGIAVDSMRLSISAVKSRLGANAEDDAEWWQETAAFLADATERLLADRSPASTTTAEPSPSPEIVCLDCGGKPGTGHRPGCVPSRPVSTDEEEGQGFEDGGLQSRPSGGDS